MDRGAHQRPFSVYCFSRRRPKADLEPYSLRPFFSAIPCFHYRPRSTYHQGLEIGFGGNCVLPARLGELVRAVYFGKKEEMSSSSALGTVVVERILDGFMILIIL